MFLDVLKYKQWADRRTLDAVKRIEGQQHAQAFTFACQQLHHMVRVEELFRARLSGEPDPHDSTNSEVVPGLNELDTRLTASNAWLLENTATWMLSEWFQPLHFRFVDGQVGQLSRAEILFHLVNHGTYHRGAIGHALDRAGAPRPADTYTVYIHAAQPQRRETPARH